FGNTEKKCGIFFMKPDATLAVAGHVSLVEGGTFIIKECVRHRSVPLTTMPVASFPLDGESSGRRGIFLRSTADLELPVAVTPNTFTKPDFDIRLDPVFFDGRGGTGGPGISQGKCQGENRKQGR